jgi:hypothetical protein
MTWFQFLESKLERAARREALHDLGSDIINTTQQQRVLAAHMLRAYPDNLRLSDEIKSKA